MGSEYGGWLAACSPGATDIAAPRCIQTTGSSAIEMACICEKHT